MIFPYLNYPIYSVFIFKHVNDIICTIINKSYYFKIHWILLLSNTTIMGGLKPFINHINAQYHGNDGLYICKSFMTAE